MADQDVLDDCSKEHKVMESAIELNRSVSNFSINNGNGNLEQVNESTLNFIGTLDEAMNYLDSRIKQIKAEEVDTTKINSYLENQNDKRKEKIQAELNELRNLESKRDCLEQSAQKKTDWIQRDEESIKRAELELKEAKNALTRIIVSGVAAGAVTGVFSAGTGLFIFLIRTYDNVKNKKKTIKMKENHLMGCQTNLETDTKDLQR